uniref:Uncharacterized protein n=1 Tax=Sphaerodactylus townsendi TaxID=933632 RepID=A0ACB8GBR5_9SAUR
MYTCYPAPPEELRKKRTEVKEPRSPCEAEDALTARLYPAMGAPHAVAQQWPLTRGVRPTVCLGPTIPARVRRVMQKPVATRSGSQDLLRSRVPDLPEPEGPTRSAPGGCLLVAMAKPPDRLGQMGGIGRLVQSTVQLVQVSKALPACHALGL